MTRYGTLIFFSGKMGAGKSTLAARIASERGAVLVSEDAWLAALYPGEIKDFDDYRHYSSRLKPLLRAHVEHLLLAGLTIVMDFPGNTKKQRAWFREIFSPHDIPHALYYVAAADAVCLQHLEQRRQEQPDRVRFDTEDVFRQVTGYFEPPEPSEGFNVERVDRG